MATAQVLASWASCGVKQCLREFPSLKTRCCLIPILLSRLAEEDVITIRDPSQYKGLSRYGELTLYYTDKTVARPSHLYNGNAYTNKTTVLYWDPRCFLCNVSLMMYMYQHCCWLFVAKLVCRLRIAQFSDKHIFVAHCYYSYDIFSWSCDLFGIQSLQISSIKW